MIKKSFSAFLVLILLLLCAYVIVPSSTLFQYMISAERSIAGLKLQRLKTETLEIEYLRGGTGTTLVVLHGFGADKDNWNRLSGYLTDHFDVVAIDLPGFGNSTSNINLEYDVFSQVSRLNDILNALEIDKMHLAGSSMGGYIAGNYAAQFPDKVKKLWLISPFGVMNSEISEMFSAVKNGHNPVVLPRTESEFQQLFDFLFVEPPFIPETIIKHLASKAKERVEINTKIFDQIHRMSNGVPQPDSPLDLVLKSYNGSVLVLWGNNDRVLHVSGAEVLKQVIPNATISIMKNVGHLPMMERPKETADLFLTFASD